MGPTFSAEGLPAGRIARLGHAGAFLLWGMSFRQQHTGKLRASIGGANSTVSRRHELGEG